MRTILGIIWVTALVIATMMLALALAIVGFESTFGGTGGLLLLFSSAGVLAVLAATRKRVFRDNWP